MRIENKPITAVSSYSAAANLTRPPKAREPQLDSVQLSETAVSFAGMIKQIKNDSIVKNGEYTQKVEDIAQRVRENTYELDPYKTAASMLV